MGQKSDAFKIARFIKPFNESCLELGPELGVGQSKTTDLKDTDWGLVGCILRLEAGLGMEAGDTDDGDGDPSREYDRAPRKQQLPEELEGFEGHRPTGFQLIDS